MCASTQEEYEAWLEKFSSNLAEVTPKKREILVPDLVGDVRTTDLAANSFIN